MTATNAHQNVRDEFAQLTDDWESAASYLSIFIDESQQTLDELTEALLALEAGGGRENIEQLFIAAHRIKGSAASIGLNRPARLAHLMEDLLQMLVYDGRAPAPKVADGLLACTDGLREYVNAMSEGRPEKDQFADLAEQLLDAIAICDAALHGEKPREAPPGMPAESPPAETPAAIAQPAQVVKAAPSASERVNRPVAIGHELHQRVAESLRDNEQENILVGHVVFEPDLPLVGLKARLVCSKLSNLGELRFVDPPLAEIETLDELPSLRFGVATDKRADELQQSLHVAGVERILIEPLVRKQRVVKAAAPRQAVPVEGGAKPTETLRVDVDRLDRLMNLAGQLAIGKARVSQIGDKLKQLTTSESLEQIVDQMTAELKRLDGDGTPDEEDRQRAARRLAESLEIVRREAASLAEVRGSVNHLFETIHLLDSVSDGIRQSVMDMRMLPIGPLFTRFHRVIRDITHANGKDIRLAISGEKTELDKRMIDELGDPMIHLVRNAADHGIEPPDARASQGKPRQGTISLDAFHRGSSIVIRVSDDGRGLNAERIRAKAVEKGLVSAADAETLAPHEIFQFIWHPGLSTAERVTDVSGRGVGMDIVRSKIKELSGTVDVESQLGQGTTFTIRLPLTLAVLPSLMVEVDRDVFCIPLESVVEIVGVKRRDMATVQGRWTAPIRDRVVAVAALDGLFRWNGEGRAPKRSESDETMLVVIGEDARQIGLAVDRVLGEEDVVIKSIADNYRNVAGVAGASILGDGRISLILDPPTLIEMASRPALGAGKTLENVP